MISFIFLSLILQSICKNINAPIGKISSKYKLVPMIKKIQPLAAKQKNHISHNSTSIHHNPMVFLSDEVEVIKVSLPNMMIHGQNTTRVSACCIHHKLNQLLSNLTKKPLLWKIRQTKIKDMPIMVVKPMNQTITQ